MGDVDDNTHKVVLASMHSVLRENNDKHWTWTTVSIFTNAREKMHTLSEDTEFNFSCQFFVNVCW